MKKLLSLLLSMTMIMGIIVMPVKAEETQTTGIYEIINSGIESASAYIGNQLDEVHNDGGVTYGFEWYIISMLRAGKTIDNAILEEYYQSVEAEVQTWTADKKPTDVERTALAMTVMGKDITDIGGVNLAEIIYNSSRLDDGANELIYGLIALDAADIAIPETALWNRDTIIEELLGFQTSDGGFGLYDNTETDMDMTAMSIQALVPYQDKNTVKTATDSAVLYLKTTISDEYEYAGNSNTTAQVLLALACLNVDVTDEANGFGNGESNIIKSIETFRNTEGNGYMYDGMINSAATYQVLQAYDGYRKAHLYSKNYWDFNADNNESVATQSPAPEVIPTEIPTEVPTPETTATPENVYVTIVSQGAIVTDKNGEYVAQAPVTVIDRDGDGMLTVDEALYAAHEEYYNGGAQAGYSTFTGMYGLSLAKLWGVGEEGTGAAAGYYLNNASCWSMTDEVSEGDYLAAFNYYDAAFYSDKYAFFTENEVTVNSGSGVTLTLKYNGYDEYWNPVVAPAEGAKVVFLGNADGEALTTNADGQVTIDFPISNENKIYYAMAYAEDNSIVPTVCKIDVKKKSSGGSGSTVNKITAYIRVSDHEGEAFLTKTAYTLEKGATAFDILEKTGLDIETRRSVYGIYVSAIEGLAEFDEGSNSGWTYRVNGKYINQSSSEYVLSNGDYVEWIYTKGDDEHTSSGEVVTQTPAPESTQAPDTTETPSAIPEKEFSETTFSDVSDNDWFYEGVEFVYKNGLMDGTGEGFEPDIAMTRAMLVTVLHRVDGESNTESTNVFSDVEQGQWYYNAVVWAKESGIVDGITDAEFNPDGEITREQMAVIFYRYCMYKGYDVSPASDLGAFDDRDATSDWAIDAFKWANGAGLINGISDNVLSPAGKATRAQVATIFIRLCETLTVNK